MTSIKRILIPGVLILGVIGAGCASDDHRGDFGDAPVPTVSYDGLIDKWTQGDKAYQSGRQSFAVTVTLLTSEVTEFQIFQEAKNRHSSADEYKTAREKGLYDAESKTTFFVCLYTHNNDENNLDKTNSIWNMFLDVGGRRFAATAVKKIYENPTRLQEKFPYVTVWDNKYYVEFAVPTREVATGPSMLTISGVLGGAHFQFPK